MTPDPHRQIPPLDPPIDVPSSRFALKPPGRPTGHVDGAWWPRSAALPDELTALLGDLRGELGRVSRVSFHREGWADAPRRMTSADGRVALDGFTRHTDPHSLTVIATSGRRLTLLVVPHATDATLARRVLDTASTAANGDTTKILLAGSAGEGTDDVRTDDAAHEPRADFVLRTATVV